MFVRARSAHSGLCRRCQLVQWAFTLSPFSNCLSISYELGIWNNFSTFPWYKTFHLSKRPSKINAKVAFSNKRNIYGVVAVHLSLKHTCHFTMLNFPSSCLQSWLSAMNCTSLSYNFTASKHILYHIHTTKSNAKHVLHFQILLIFSYVLCFVSFSAPKSCGS